MHRTIPLLPPLRLIAQPRALYRERYICETDPDRSMAQRFVRADVNPQQLAYPTIEIPWEWLATIERCLYIRLTLVTVPNAQAPIRCVHPYPIDTEDIRVIKDPATNSLYFPVSEDEMVTCRKSFQFTQKKLTKYQLKSYGCLRIFNSSKPTSTCKELKPMSYFIYWICLDEKDGHYLTDATDVKKLVETYQLRYSQLVFCLATFHDSIQQPIIYDASSVFSHVMAAVKTSAVDDIMSFRCSPQHGSCFGGEEVIMVIPNLDKRKVVSLRFLHPSLDKNSSISIQFLDTKTILFHTPPCPIPLTKDKPIFSIPIVISQNGIEIARVNFVYEAFHKCQVCNALLEPYSGNRLTNNKRSPDQFPDNDNTIDRTYFDRKTSQEMHPTFIRSHSTVARTTILTQDYNSSLHLDDTACVKGEGEAWQSSMQVNSCFENINGNAAQQSKATELKLNKPMETVSRKRTKLTKEVNNETTDLLQVLAHMANDSDKVAIESIAAMLNDEMKRYLIFTSDTKQSTPQ